ncbi:MAG: ABC-2 family transporter protein [Candidatus Eisenbacteria bacterium]
MNALRLLVVYFRIGLLGDAQYRVNFLFQLLETGLGMGSVLAAIWVVFSQTDSLGGWKPAELTALIGIYFIVLGSINVMVAPSLQKFMEDIVTGNFDYTLTKPADAQVLVSVSEVRIWRLADVLLGVAALIVSIVRESMAVGWLEGGKFLLALIAGAVMVYSFWIVLATLAFWFIRVENILQIFWAMYTAGRWPVGLYPGWLKWTLTLVVPVAFAVTVPAEAVSGRASGMSLLGALGLACVLFAFSRWFWRIGIQKYAGASS